MKQPRKSSKSKKATAAYPLPHAITIDTVEALCMGLVTRLHESPDLVLDASHVQHITTPGAQLLLALEKTMQQSGRRLCLTHAGEPMRSLFETLGLEAHFTQWTELSS